MNAIPLKALLDGVAVTDDLSPVTAVVTDSRAAGPGSVFIAIKGERVDGHDYAARALAGGAAVWYFKFRKPKASVKGSDDLDEFEFDDDDEDEADAKDWA